MLIDVGITLVSRETKGSPVGLPTQLPAGRQQQGRHNALNPVSATHPQQPSYPIPGDGTFDIEQFSGHNIPLGPPPFVRFIRTASDPKLTWRRIHDLALFLPEKNPDGTIHIGEPILLTDKCIGLSSHSGIPSTIVSRGTKVHVAWGEATDPKENTPGVPTYVATIDRETRVMTPPTLVGYGPPANDIHNTPCIRGQTSRKTPDSSKIFVHRTY